ncbi:N-acetylmannosamine kinase [Pleomorphomonas sp. T1.2MG-36]|uniref:ROK family protein n=1 Tax=Pleomorphomonas sp. T1.2MG-36 TaxID=3041167 RepID=UPI0024775057|nr:ROK family protein [Pleomorphomonas sp. T1.2MG-36]CAI9410333.1 N-acetylmannosamine kinase [Pleomorphomonas sp. T1.2MG-36]
MSARTTRTGQGSNSAQVRLYNERIVLQALRRFGEASKTDLAREAGLTNNAIGAITAYLAAAGLVVELGKKREGLRGQPATMLALAPEGAYSIGVRIDRVGYETICVDFGGRILASRAHDTLLPPPKDMLATVVADIKSIETEIGPERWERLAGIGLAQPYHLGSWLRELELPASSFRLWDDFDFGAALEAQTGIPVFLENDGNAAAIAELFYGHGRTRSDFIYLFIGGAVGGGVVLDGDCLRGSRGNAGDFAMMPVPASALPSAPRPERSFDVLLTRTSLAGLRRHLRWHGHAVDTLAEIGDLFRRAPRPAAFDEWIDDAVAAFVPAILSTTAALDVDQVILEGDLDCGLVEIIVERLAKALATAAPESVPVAQVIEGSFRARAGALGAATLPLFFNFSPRSSILTGTAPMFREFRDYAVRA